MPERRLGIFQPRPALSPWLSLPYAPEPFFALFLSLPRRRNICRRCSRRNCRHCLDSGIWGRRFCLRCTTPARQETARIYCTRCHRGCSLPGMPGIQLWLVLPLFRLIHGTYSSLSDLEACCLTTI